MGCWNDSHILRVIKKVNIIGLLELEVTTKKIFSRETKEIT